MVKRVIQVFRCFRDSYQTQRERLANHVKHAPWDFPSAMIFARFNQFLNRMLQLEVRSDFCFSVQVSQWGCLRLCFQFSVLSLQGLFDIMLDFQRMEKLEFGGLKGKLYSEQAAQMYREFSNYCQVLRHSENSPLDLNSQVKWYKNHFEWHL